MTGAQSNPVVDAVAVTQADREAAAALYDTIYMGEAPKGRANMIAGRYDDLAFVQAFARHRQSADAALVEALEPFAAHVEACRQAFPNDPVSAGEVCRGSVSFADFERAYAALTRGERT